MVVGPLVLSLIGYDIEQLSISLVPVALIAFFFAQH